MSQIALDEMRKHVDGLKPGHESNWIGFCPLHGEVAGKSTPSFSFNEETGQWFCFASCGGGSFGYFLKLRGKSREAIDKTMERLRPFLSASAKKGTRLRQANAFCTPFPLPERLLGLWERCPTTLTNAGFEQKLLWEHDVGYDETNKRITWPIRDIEGTLAGIVGRDDTGTSPMRYKTYASELRGFGIPSTYSFDKSSYLWRGDRVWSRLFQSDEPETLYVCEGYKACLWMVQAGFENTVALQTASMSTAQATLIERLGATVVLCLDNNAAGWKGTTKIGYRLSGCKVRVISYPSSEVQQPDDLCPEDLHEAVNQASAYIKWRST